MRFFHNLCFGILVFLIVLSHDAVADKEEESSTQSDEVSEISLKNISDSSEAEGPPDSHEAMNNRDLSQLGKPRTKRSYEFLMGLINNNSRYLVTKDEPTINNLEKKQQREDLGTSERLLELMVKIASNPEQWEKVHRLLQQIDKDITASKQLVENLRLQSSNEHQRTNKTKNIVRTSSQVANSTLLNKELPLPADNGQMGKNLSDFSWPKFPTNSPSVNFILNTPTVSPIKDSNLGLAKTYPKYFSYHRVTGKPFVNKDTKAYIAVSVKTGSEEESSEDLELEHELRQLKPWTKSKYQNLKSVLFSNHLDSKVKSVNT